MTPSATRWRAGKPRAIAPAIVLLAALGLAACGRGDAQNAAKAAPGIPVVVVDAVRKSVPIRVEAVGNVEAIASVALKSRVDGQILKVGFHDGDQVHAGQMLFQIDPRPAQSQLRQAEAKLAADLAQLGRARDQEARYKDLLQKNFISPDYYNQIRANYDAARAAVDADKAALDNARLQLDYCTLRAPLDGRAGRILVQQGNLVKANDANPLVTINQLSPIFVNFSIAENYLEQIRAAMRASSGSVDVIAKGRDGQDSRIEGRLSFVDNTVDVATGTIRLRATMANRSGELWPGQFVRVALTLGQIPDAIVVPADAVQIGPKGNYVFVIDAAAKARMQTISTGPTVAGETVVTSGLKGGEKVVVDGQSRLLPGAGVELKKAGPAS